MKARLRCRRGSTLIEFTLAGIPMLLLLTATVEIGRGMWTWQTLTYAVKEGARFAAVHGQNCVTAPNACAVSVRQIAAKVQQSGSGLFADELNLRMTSGAASITCRLDSCLLDETVWPPDPENRPGGQLEFSATYPFRSAVTLLWPGVRGGGRLPAIQLSTAAREEIQF